MIPQRLVLEGVYSYREKQEIDFSSLTGGGIFGIFGAVGSGKSAILEAMTYALYGQIERLGQTDQRGYNMMNLQSDRMFIDFEFTHDRNRYRFTVSAKRRKTNFETVTAPERQGYILTEQEWKPLSDQKIRGGITAESILGLSYDHFRRTVIIPQGRFQEFIQLTPKNRTEMMESLFDLGRFNLYGKTAALLNSVKSEKSFLEGRMEELAKYREEDLNALLQELEQFNKERIAADSKIEAGKIQLTSLHELQQMHEEFRILRKQEETMQSKIPEMNNRREQLNHYKRIFNSFHPLLKQKSRLVEERVRKEENCRQTRTQLEELNEEIRKGETAWEELKSNWENREHYSGQLRSLKASLQIYRLISEINILTGEQGSLKAVLHKYEQDEKQLTHYREKLHREIQEKEQGLPDSEQMARTEDWFHRFDRALNEHETLTAQASELQKEQSRILSDFMAGFDLQQIDPEPVEAEEQARRAIQKKQSDLNSALQILQNEKIHLQTEKKLFSLSGDLQEGTPCPLCGAANHPAPLSEGDFAAREKKIEEQAALLAEKDRVLQADIRSLNSYTAAYKSLETQQKRLEGQLNEKKEKTEQLRKEFTWSSFKAEERELFFQYQKETRRQESEIKGSYEKLHETDKALKELKSSSETSLRRDLEITLALEKNRSARATWEEQLSEEHRKTKPADPEEEIRQLQDFLSTLENEYPRRQREREQKINRLQILEKNLSTGTALLKEQELREADLKKSMDEALSATGQNTLEDVLKLLSHELDIEREEKEIESFNREKSIQQDRLKKLESLIGDRVYSPEEHTELKERVADLEKTKSDLLSRLGALQKQKEDLERGLQEKTRLMENFGKTLTREENLKELTSLFTGKKFTAYIAAIYLQELCIRANERFFPLSGRTLELTFEDNAILVRDLLNEGKTRLVKTLSGGQTFQAALSLALALADQIGMGDDHFFFLDEGFGTLDRETLETVMMTLREISRDGRIIGLISHVDDLRQDLDVWLQINRSPEKGSRISSSWTE